MILGTEPTASLCSLERVVRPARLQRGLWTAGTSDVDTGGGMRVLSPDEGERSGRLAGREDVQTGRPEREPTGAGANSAPTRHRQQRDGNTLATKEPPGKKLLA